MYKIKSQTAPKIFLKKFHKPTPKYPINFSTSNYIINVTILKNSMKQASGTLKWNIVFLSQIA